MFLVAIGTADGFCAGTAGIWQFAGWIVTVLKVIIPAILVIIGIITLGKAVISDDDKLIKDGINKLIKKFIVAVVIFFIPSIIKTLFNVISGTDATKNDTAVCITCIANPNSSACKSHVKTD